MKNSILFATFLSILVASVDLCAQATKKAPARRPVRSTVTNPAATGTTTTGKSTPRGNVPDLPRTTAPVQPAQPAQPAPVSRLAERPRPVPARPERQVGFGYQKGDNLLNIGVGLSSYYYGNPIGASFEAGIDNDISVGFQLDYNSGNFGDNYYNGSRWRYTSTYIGARGSYHVNRLLNLNTKQVDLYAGLGLGYRSFRWNDSNYGYGYNYNSGLLLNYFIGGKYYFSDKVGGFLELGYTGLSSSRVGLAVKF